MTPFFLGWLATPGAAAGAGVVSLIALVWKGRHRDKSGHISRLHISSAVMLAAIVYTLAMVLVGYFWLHTPFADTISKGFGDDRIAWLFVFMTIDAGVRLARVFDGAYLHIVDDDLS